MQFIDELRAEHVLIERVALSLRSFARAEDGDPTDAVAFIDFLTTFAGAWHHEREESVLFPVLTGELQLPDRGPLEVLLEEHRRMAALLQEMRAAADHAGFRSAALDYTQALLLHIDAENSVLFPECDDRLRRAGVTSLPSRPLTDCETAAMLAGERLVTRYPADLIDPALLRGEGCIVCPSYGIACDGIEHEWWNQWEWEEFDEHVAGA